MNFLTYLGVIGLASLKVIPGVVVALAAGFSPLETFLTLSIGAFSSVLFFSFFGTKVKNWLRMRRLKKHGPKAVNYKKARKLLRIWKRFGIVGVALLTPPVITPPIGTAIAVTMGERLERILVFMLISILAWSAVFAFFGELVVSIFH